jgi:hypothetical protein
MLLTIAIIPVYQKHKDMFYVITVALRGLLRKQMKKLWRLGINAMR